jgi:hypothetical protein
MKPHGPVRIVRKWCGLCINPVLRCLDNPEGLNNEYLPSLCGPQLRELANDIRLGTVVSSPDLSGAWVTIQG